MWTELTRKISCPSGRGPGPPPGSRRKDRTRCWHRIRRSPGRKRHRPAVSAPRWRGSAGSAARSDLARRRRWPAARRSCPGRPAGRRGGPARLRHTRCRSPAPGCRRLRGPAARSRSCASGDLPTLPILVPWPPSCAGPDRRSQRPAGPRPPGCAAHDQALQSHPQRLRRRSARQPHGPLAIRTAA